MAKDLYRYFRIEARELIDQLGQGVLELERGGDSADPELVLRLLRWAHTLKGAARVVRQAEIANLIHGVEDLLAPLRDGAAQLPRQHIDRLLGAFDQIGTRLAALPQPDLPAAALDGRSAGALEPGPRAAEAPPRIVRADVVEVDALLEGLGEIGGELAAIRRAVASLDTARELADALAGAAPGAARAVQARLQLLLDGLGRSLTAGVERIDRELGQSRDAAERLRLSPVASIFTTLERSVRDAAHSQGKQVVFSASGGTLRIDGEVLDVVLGALTQLMRNAVAHGIEPEERRRAAGKAAAGRITLDVVRRGYRAWFRCHDDGRGVDLAAVRNALAKRGIAARADGHDDTDQLLDQLLRGGISTSAGVTELAGRGIGLDVVRAAMERLGGKALIRTSAGAGTTIELGVPLSLAALDVLMIEADGQLMAMPLDAVEGTLRVAHDSVLQTPEGQAIVYEDQLLPFLPLSLELRAKAAHQWAPRAMTAVIVGTGEARIAVAVTRLCGIDSVVLRALPGLAPADAQVLGLHLDSAGSARIVLDPDQLAHMLARRRQAGADMAPARLPILIIDDSLTTRMLESSILESAGYEVALAMSAEEGLELARRTPFALFLVDVEMPGMNGFEFVETAGADPRLCDIPAILVTSLDSPEDRRRGLAAGARDYIVKNEFDQSAFLARIGELV